MERDAPETPNDIVPGSLPGTRSGDGATPVSADPSVQQDLQTPLPLIPIDLDEELEAEDDTYENGYPLSRIGQVLLGTVSLVFVGLFAVAASVTPDPRGFGTHQRLGLPPCSFITLFGIPCPSCGGTTAFAHFVRGQWLQSLKVNPGAALLAFVGAVAVPWCWYSIWRGVAWRVHDPSRTFVRLSISLTVITLVHWVSRVISW